MFTTAPYGHEVAALTTIEVAERLALKAAATIDTDPQLAKRLLACLAEETTRRTATRVKDQKLSDGIAHDARTTVSRLRAVVESDLRLAAQAERERS